MAQFGIHGTPKSVAALASLFVLIGLMVFAAAGGLVHEPVSTQIRVGLVLYLLSFLTIGLGFWSKEDSVAIGGIVGLSLLMILDILLRIGVLSYNGIRVLGGGGH